MRGHGAGAKVGRMKPNYRCEFEAALSRVPGKGGWVFVTVPPEHAPAVTVGWGRTPVRATIDGRSWDTSVWRDRSGRTQLAVPKSIRGERDHTDTVAVTLEYSIIYQG